MYKCPRCEVRTLTLEAMQKHAHSKHGLIMHACFDCAKTFATKSSLKTHTNGFHLGIVHPCNTCGKKFRSLPVLLSHAKLHENVIFECDKCPKKFNTRKYLKQHIENVHTDTVYECDYCDTTLTVTVPCSITRKYIFQGRRRVIIVTKSSLPIVFQYIFWRPTTPPQNALGWFSGEWEVQGESDCKHQIIQFSFNIVR